MRKGFLYALSLSMILASQSLTALAEDQAPTGTETPASSSDIGEDASEPSSEVTNGAGESEENPTVEAETKNGASDKEADEETKAETVAPDNASDEETKKEESVPQKTPVEETPVVPAPAAEAENTPVAKAMAPMNAPVSQSTFMIGDTGYDTLDKALDAAQNTAGDVTITLTRDVEPTGWYKINHKKDNGKIILDLGGNRLQVSFGITLSSPIQMVFQNGKLQGNNYYSYDSESPNSSSYDFVVTSSSASMVFQDLELDNIWAGYTSQDAYPEDAYVFQILRCRNNTLIHDNLGGRLNAHTLTFGSRTTDCKVLIADSRLFNLKSVKWYWPGDPGDARHTQVTLNNSIVTGEGNYASLSAFEDASPYITSSTGGMIDQYNWDLFDVNDPDLHYFYVPHWDFWSRLSDDIKVPPYVANKEARWTTFEQLQSENAYNYMWATMLVPADTVKIGVIFEDGHEQDYPDLGLTCTVATNPVDVSTGFDEPYSLPTYFEETRKLATVSEWHDDGHQGYTTVTPYDPYFYVPTKFYNMQGNDPSNDLTVKAGATVVTYTDQDGNISISSDPTAVSTTVSDDNNSSLNATDTPAFQEVYDLVWNDPDHNLVTSDGAQFYDYRLKAVRKTYTVDFDANGGTNEPEVEKSLRYYEDSIKKPETKGMTRDGYTFTGWYLDADATIEFKNFGTLLDSKIVEKLTQEGALKDGSTTITLYAGWKKNEEKPAQPSQTAKASSATAVSFPRTSNPVSSTGKLFIPRTGVGAEPKSAE